jgi:predicted ester cyclase
MSLDDNKALVRRYYNEIANVEVGRAQAAAEQLLTSDFIFYPNMPEAQRGIEMHKRFLARHHEISSDQRWACQEMVAEGDTVVCRVTIQGTHHGIFHGIAPAGRRISVSGVDFFRIAHNDGQEFLGHPTSKIAELRRYLDLKRMLDQMSGEAESGPTGQ